MEFEQEIDLLLRAVRDAGKLILKYFRQNPEVREKAPLDLVTEADLASENLIRGRVNARFPLDSIVAEESGSSGESARRWYIDPLDGTVNFAHGSPEFAACAAFADPEGIAAAAVYSPYQDLCFTAVRGRGAFLNGLPIECAMNRSASGSIVYANHHGLRRDNIDQVVEMLVRVGPYVQGIRNAGSMSLALCSVACGWLDGALAVDMDYFSTPASSLIMMEAGVKITDISGEDYRPNSTSLVAANPTLHQDFMRLLADRPGGTSF